VKRRTVGGRLWCRRREDQAVEVAVGPGVGDRVRRTGKTNSAGGLGRVEEGGGGRG